MYLYTYIYIMFKNYRKITNKIYKIMDLLWICYEILKLKKLIYSNIIKSITKIVLFLYINLYHSFYYVK